MSRLLILALVAAAALPAARADTTTSEPAAITTNSTNSTTADVDTGADADKPRPVYAQVAPAGENAPTIAPAWPLALLSVVGVVFIGLMVYTEYRGEAWWQPTPAQTMQPTRAPTMQPTEWYEGVQAKISDGWQTVAQAVTSTFAKLFGKDESDVKVDANAVRAEFDQANGRRSDSGNGVPVQISSVNAAEAYQVLQVLSTTSGATVTTLLVQQLQAANYTGPMPTMVTTVVTSVTDGGSSDSSDSNTIMITVAIVVAAALVLIAVLVVGALIYMYKLNKNQAPAAQASAAASAPPMMGSVGVSMNPPVMNPMHANEAKSPTACIA